METMTEKKGIQFDGLLHGGDYNPEQWLDSPEILAEDIELMQKAHINCATLGVFSWSMYEPREGEYDFGWLLTIIDNLYAAGIKTILATPSGARPAWLDKKYPDAMRCNDMGIRNHHGIRHNHCMTSQNYRAKTQAMDTALANAVKGNPALLAWHISNEYGGECFCPACVEKFRSWLKERYGTIEALNKAWWTTFWSHCFTDFDEVEPPYANGEQSMPGLKLDWQRFTTWNTTDFMKLEIAAVRAVTPGIPVTTNFMRLYEGLDYRVLAKELDFICWDAYPAWHNDNESEADTAADVVFDHAMMRGLGGGRPFYLMESTPSLVNWQPYNKLKRPGMHLASSMQAVACGSDSVQYFQWRKGRGSFEQYHGAVIDHTGGKNIENDRVFRDVTQVGAMLESLAAVQGSTIRAEAAFVYDWDNRWAVQGIVGLADSTKKFDEATYALYRPFVKHGIAADVIAWEDDFTPYKLLVLPMHYILKPGFAERLRAFVRGGGHLLATYLTGYVDASTLCFTGGFPGDGLTELFGITATEMDVLYPKDRNCAQFADDGTQAEIRDYCELLRPVGDSTVALATYGEDFYAGVPCITQNPYGAGCAWYLGARVDEAGTEKLLQTIWRQCGIATEALPQGVQHTVRTGADGRRFHFFLNMIREQQSLPVPRGGAWLAGVQPQGDCIVLAQYQVGVYVCTD